MGRLCGECAEIVWRLWEDCLEGRVLGGCLEGEGRFSRACQVGVQMAWGGLKGVGRLFGGCVRRVLKVWGGCLDGVGRLSGLYREVVG